MTTTPAVSTPPATNSNGTTNTADAMNQLSGNFDEFLQLLTTQLQNQDPLSPMDSNQFTQQLVEFSQVEQQIDTNTNLQSLITLGQGQSNTMATSYLGKSVVMTGGQGALTNGAVTWDYSLDNTADSTQLTVTDANGDVVYTGSGDTASGTHEFDWNGEDNNGNQLPDGLYTLAVTATAADGSTVTSTIASKGTVTGIDTTGTNPQLVIGSSEIPLSQASLIGD